MELEQRFKIDGNLYPLQRWPRNRRWSEMVVAHPTFPAGKHGCGRKGVKSFLGASMDLKRPITYSFDISRITQ